MNTDHAQTVAQFGLGACEVEVGAAWPYECMSKDRNPDAVVFVCHSHGAWWWVA